MDPGDQIIADIVNELERAWNAADGIAFARPFAEDADFVNIRGEHHRTREAIAKGHQAIFSTVYKGSVVRLQVAAVRTLAPAVLLAHVKS
ncbi:MAG TPA: SgcJ/EcaC family oxidoreductase, partial [Vicinamibacterales bacterium]|nr:SgcJ/EcaC family oxidoreductase [Vicinamibacterales bacterium]